MKKPNYIDSKKRDTLPVEYEYLIEDIMPITNEKLYFLRTYGCQMNVHDSEQIKYYLEKLGFNPTQDIKLADVVILNTCAIRENAKDKLVGFLSIAKHLKETVKPDLVIALSGCIPQLEEEVNYFEEKHKYIDIIIGTHNIIDLPKLLIEREKKQTIKVESNSNVVLENVKYQRDSKISAWVNITYGCNNFCTYCIVPLTRGKERSRKKEDIINEINQLVKEGYQEVTLLGQNVNSYGYDFEYDYKFFNLLKDVAKTNINRIRFVTSNPWNFTDELIDVIAEYKNIMPYIHLPVQSGSDEILKKMNRKYTALEYKTLFDKIKNKIPNVSITTDIIVGFPNETEKDFQKTLDLVNYCKFDGAFTFIYSKRKGTIADKMEDNVSLEEKEKRLQTLNTLVNKYSFKNNQKLLNKEVEVLLMGLSQKDKTKLYGYTDTMKLVNVEGSKDYIGKIKTVVITEAKSFSLDGVLKD